jgi:hypothetical protein
MQPNKSLQNTPFATTSYYNKATGKDIDTKSFGSKAESGIWGSSGAGEGYTNYRVQYDAQGNPVFYPEKNLSGMKEFVAKDLPGILSVLRFIPGAQIPVMLAQAGAAAYSGAKPGDVLKNLATTFVASNLGNILSKGIPGTDFKGLTSLGFDMPTTDFGKMAFQAGTSGLSSLIQGGSPQDALKAAGLSAVGRGISGLMPTSTEFDYSKILQAAAPALASGRIKNADIFRLIQALASKPGARTKTPPGTR